jgi:hypothetical protein
MAAKCASFNNFIGEREKHRWQLKTERLSGLQVDDKSEFGWLLDREIGGLLALKKCG